MKAVLCKEFGPPESLVVEDIASPEPEAGQVVLDVHAAAVNFPDVLIIQNKYQFKPPQACSKMRVVSTKSPSWIAWKQWIVMGKGKAA